MTLPGVADTRRTVTVVYGCPLCVPPLVLHIPVKDGEGDVEHITLAVLAHYRGTHPDRPEADDYERPV